MTKQLELLNLIKENPEMEVKFFVSTDCINIDWGYNEQMINNIRVTEYGILGDQIYSDYDSMLDDYCAEQDCESNKNIETLISGMMKRVILVELGEL